MGKSAKRACSAVELEKVEIRPDSEELLLFICGELDRSDCDAPLESPLPLRPQQRRRKA